MRNKSVFDLKSVLFLWLLYIESNNALYSNIFDSRKNNQSVQTYRIQCIHDKHSIIRSDENCNHLSQFFWLVEYMCLYFTLFALSALTFRGNSPPINSTLRLNETVRHFLNLSAKVTLLSTLHLCMQNG